MYAGMRDFGRMTKLRSKHSARISNIDQKNDDDDEWAVWSGVPGSDKYSRVGMPTGLFIYADISIFCLH
jgi:hypothetical protein